MATSNRISLAAALVLIASSCRQPEPPPSFPFTAPEEQVVALAPVVPIRQIEATIAARATLSEALGDHGLGAPQVHEVVEALAAVTDFRKIRSGASYTLRLIGSEQRLDYFRLEGSALDVVEARRDDAGALVGQRIDVPVRTVESSIGVSIRGSLYESLEQAGESPELATVLADVFAWDIDFQRDQQPGDHFRMVVEKVYSGDTFIRYGRVLAAEYDGAIGTFRTFWYEPTDAPATADYFLEDGRSARKLFLATPLQLTRVTSSFSMSRRHPILGYNRAHLGVDYAAPTGTPVRAMATGVILAAGWSGGSGNLVRIRHRSGLESAYAHLQKIARGIRPGTRVNQKETIGYVGATGLATGPHLHFAVKRDGRFVNPQKLDLARLESVPAARRDDFQRIATERSARLAAIRLGQDPSLTIASADGLNGATGRTLLE